MSGDINAINSWARSVATRSQALALNTGISGSDARGIIIRRDSQARAAAAIATNRKQRTGK
jgi:hypothetical protein